MKQSPAILNAGWTGASQVFRLLTQLATIVLLSRILSVADFGLMTMASVVVMFAELFSGFGMTPAVVRAKRITPEFLNTIFWSNLAIGAAIGLAFVVSSPLIAILFNEPRLIAILCLLATLFPITALGNTHVALLERELRFPSIARSEIASSLTGLCVALFFAWRGAGVYALVAQNLAVALLMSMQAWLLSRWIPRFIFRLAELKGVIRFGGHLVGFNIINYVSRNADTIIVGKILGSGELGLYNLAFRLMYFPVQTIVVSVNRVLFPLYSQRVRNGETLETYFLRVAALVSFVVAPMSLGLWAVREPLIGFLFNEQWQRSAIVLAWLAPAGFLQALHYSTGSVFMAAGRTDTLLKLAIANAVIFVIAFSIGARGGIVSVAQAYLAAHAVTFALAIGVTAHFLRISILRFTSTIIPATLCATVMACAIVALDAAFGAGVSAFVRLATLVPAGVLIYLGLSMIFAKDALAEITTFLRRGGQGVR